MVGAELLRVRMFPFTTKPGASITAGWLLILVALSPLSADEGTGSSRQKLTTADAPLLRPQDEMWLISTRHLCQPTDHADACPDLQVIRYTDGTGWHDSDLDSLRSSDPDALVTCYVHGYHMDWEWAQIRGWSVYSNLRCGQPPARPIRFIVWSWPSTRSWPIISDLRRKAVRTDTEAYYLAYVLNQLPQQTQVSMIGYSFGARVVTGALQIVGGGQQGDLALASTRPVRRRYRVTLLAAAVHSHWLQPGEPFDQAMSSVARLQVQFNPWDPVLRHYGILERDSSPSALGATGICADKDLGENGQRLEQLNVSNVVGNKHDVRRYLNSPKLMSRILDNVFWR